MEIIKKQELIKGSGGRDMACDILFRHDVRNQPIVIYAHGFCGFKDWGNFDRIAEKFATAGICFVKFNFSHNGTTPQAPEDFTDLQAFGANNFSKELYDLGEVIEHILNHELIQTGVCSGNIGLLGHSMGGGIVLITTANKPEIKAVATWAAIPACTTPFTNWTTDQVDEWERSGVAYYHNGRTGQDLPLYYQLYLDHLQHKDEYSITNAIAEIRVPVLLCHGTADTSVPFSAATKLQSYNSTAEIFAVDSDHVFGRKHPGDDTEFPQAMNDVLEKTVAFFLENLK